MLKELKVYLDGLENEIIPFDEFAIGEEIKKILNANQKKITEKDELAEYIGFQFMPDYPNENGGWGTYYGPIFVLPNQQGQLSEFPSIKQVDKEMLEYWRKRAGKSKHPILINRYADLVFDFEPIVLKKKIDFLMAQKVIDSAIEICVSGLDDPLGYKEKLERALGIAIQINDSGRIQKLKKVLAETEKKYAEDDKPGLWGYAFEKLLLNESGRVNLSKKEVDDLVAELESRLTRLMTPKNPDPWHVECAVKLLSQYYSGNKDEENLERVLDSLETAFRKNRHANSDGLLVSNYLQKLVQIYLEHSSFQFAKEARERIVNELSNMGDRTKFDMKEVSAEIKIKNETIEKFVKGIFGEDKPEELPLVIAKLAVNFILRKKSEQNQLDNLSKKHPLMFLIGHVVASEEGYPIISFGSISEDYNKHLLENSSKNLHFQSIFLRIAFEEMRKRFSWEEFREQVTLSPVFRSEDSGYTSKLLKLFWEKEYLTAGCLSIPLIEDAIRNLYRINNQTYIRPNNDGGYDVLTLSNLLEGGVIKRVYGDLGEDMEYYFRVLLTERAGWNLRNNFAHGINKGFFESEDVANRLVHVLICLSTLRTKKD